MLGDVTNIQTTHLQHNSSTAPAELQHVKVKTVGTSSCQPGHCPHMCVDYRADQLGPHLPHLPSASQKLSHQTNLYSPQCLGLDQIWPVATRDPGPVTGPRILERYIEISRYAMDPVQSQDILNWMEWKGSDVGLQVSTFLFTTRRRTDVAMSRKTLQRECQSQVLMVMLMVMATLTLSLLLSANVVASFSTASEIAMKLFFLLQEHVALWHCGSV